MISFFLLNMTDRIIFNALIWAIVLSIPLVIFAFYIEKKANDIATYKEIVAFYEGKELDEDSKIAEKTKRPYQRVLLAIGAGALLLAIFLLESYIIK